MYFVGAGEAIVISRRGKGILIDGGATVGGWNDVLGHALGEHQKGRQLKPQAVVSTYPTFDHWPSLPHFLRRFDPTCSQG